MQNKIRIHDKNFSLLIPNSQIEEAIEKLALAINDEYSGERPTDVVFLSVLNGSFMFTSSLVQRLNFSPIISFIKLSSYDGLHSTGEVKSLIGLDRSVEGKRVLILEDIVDSGKTVSILLEKLKELKVGDAKIASLFYKPGACNVDITVDFPAMEIGNEFIVGYGLDYDQLGRNFKDIYVVE